MKIKFYANIVSHWFTYLFSRQKCLLNCLAHPFLSLERGIHKFINVGTWFFWSIENQCGCPLYLGLNLPDCYILTVQ